MNKKITTSYFVGFILVIGFIFLLPVNSLQAAFLTSSESIDGHTAIQNIKLNSNWLSGDGDNEGVFILSNGNVGIGTTNPVTKFDVQMAPNVHFGMRTGELNAGYSQLNAYNNGGVANVGMELKASDFHWNIGNSEKMTILNSGNVGIGSTNPQVKLDVGGRINYASVPIDVTRSYDGSLLFSSQAYIENSSSLISNYGTIVTDTDPSMPFSKVILSNTYIDAENFGGGDFIPVRQGETIYVEVWVKRAVGATGTAGGVYAGMKIYDSNKVAGNSNAGRVYPAAANYTVPADGAWHKLSSEYTIPAATTPGSGPVKYIQPLIYINYNTGTIPTYWGGFIIRRKQVFRDSGAATFNGNVGIGTTAPAAKLHVVGPVGNYTINAGGYRIGNLMNPDEPSDAATRDYVDSVAGDVDASKWTTSGNNIYNKNLTGNVGVGVTSPAHKLTVGTATSDGQTVTIRGYSNDPTSWKGGAAFGYTSASVIMGELGGVAQIGGHNAAISAWSNLALNSGGGNVGIGTTNPGTYKLYVNGGNVYMSGSLGLGVAPSEKLSVNGSITTNNNTFVNKSFAMIDNINPQYILLCLNAASNDVNGEIRVTRTSGHHQAASLDIVVTSKNTGMIGGSLTTNQYTEADEKYSLVTVTYNAQSYVAIKYDGWVYPSTVAHFSGRLVTTGANSLTTVNASQISNEALLSTANSKITMTGHVGIATTTPGYRLTVGTPASAGSYSISAGGYGIANVLDPSTNTDAATKGYVDSTVGDVDASKWEVDGTNIYNKNNTNVIISNTGYRQLFIKGGSTGHQTLNLGSVESSVGSYIYNNAYYLTSNTYNPSQTAASGMQMRNDGSLDLLTNSGLTIGTAYTPTSRIKILANGNVGVGTVAPRGKLEVVTGSANTNADAAQEFTVVGADRTMGTSLANIQVASNNNQAADMGGSIAFGGRYITSNTGQANYAAIKGGKTNSTSGDYSGYLAFGTRLTGAGTLERMRIDNIGNVGIGTNSPAYTLDVNGILRVQGNTIRSGGGAINFFDGTGGSWASIGVKGVNLGDWDTAPGYGDILVGTYDFDILRDNGSSMLTIKNAGNVGIGTNSPISDLQVGSATFTGAHGSYDNSRVGLLVGNGAGSSGMVSLQLSSTYNDATTPNYGLVLVNGPSTASYDTWGIMHDGPANANGGLKFAYGAQGSNIHSVVPMVTFQKSGNVGIGTTNPSMKLDVNGSANVKNVLRSGDWRHVLSKSFTSNGVNGYLLTTAIPYDGVTNRGMHSVRVTGYAYGSAEPIDFIVNFYLYTGGITNHGWTNLGAYNPGTVRISYEGGYLKIWWSSVLYYPNFEVFTSTNNALTNTDSYFENWNITEAVSPGTNYVNATYKNAQPIGLTMAGNIRLNGNWLSGDGDAEGVFVDASGNVGVGSSTPGYKLGVSGDVGALEFKYSSDRNLKDNIKTLNNSLNKVLKLRGVTFDWKHDGSPSIGLIAQEVEKVFPDLVDGAEGGKSVQYGNLVAPLIEAVKEQQKLIDILEARITVLEKKK